MGRNNDDDYASAGDCIQTFKPLSLPASKPLSLRSLRTDQAFLAGSHQFATQSADALPPEIPMADSPP